MTNKKVKVIWGNYLQDHGYFNVSNLLIDCQEELGITDDELLFIIKVQRFTQGWSIPDKKLSNSLCSKSLQRRRRTLKDKGYLLTTEHKEKDELGQIRTLGVVYDFTGLTMKLQEISRDKNEKDERVKVLPDRTKLSKNRTEVSALNITTNINTTKEVKVERVQDTVKEKLKQEIIENFQNQIKTFKEDPQFYGWRLELSWPFVNYKPSKQDIENLNQLDTDELVQLSESSRFLNRYIYSELDASRFRYNNEYFTPTISLFTKARSQFSNLYKFYLMETDRV